MYTKCAYLCCATKQSNLKISEKISEKNPKINKRRAWKNMQK